MRVRLQRQLTIVARCLSLKVTLFGALSAYLTIGLVVLAQALDNASSSSVSTATTVLLTILWSLAVGIGPWTVLEVVRAEDRTGLVRWMALSAEAPWRETAVRAIVSWSCLLQLPLLSLPLLVILPRLGDPGPIDLEGSIVGLACFLLLVTVVTMHWELGSKSYLEVLVLAYSSIALLVALRWALVGALGRSTTLVVILVGSLLAGLLLLVRGNRRLLHLEV